MEKSKYHLKVINTVNEKQGIKATELVSMLCKNFYDDEENENEEIPDWPTIIDECLNESWLEGIIYVLPNGGNRQKLFIMPMETRIRII